VEKKKSRVIEIFQKKRVEVDAMKQQYQRGVRMKNYKVKNKTYEHAIYFETD
jgi:hypothetical protein